MTAYNLYTRFQPKSYRFLFTLNEHNVMSPCATPPDRFLRIKKRFSSSLRKVSNRVSRGLKFLSELEFDIMFRVWNSPVALYLLHNYEFKNYFISELRVLKATEFISGVIAFLSSNSCGSSGG